MVVVVVVVAGAGGFGEGMVYVDVVVVVATGGDGVDIGCAETTTSGSTTGIASAKGGTDISFNEEEMDQINRELSGNSASSRASRCWATSRWWVEGYRNRFDAPSFTVMSNDQYSDAFLEENLGSRKRSLDGDRVGAGLFRTI